MNEITITRPDDWHVHLRDGAILKAVLPFTARQFSRAIVMPNLSPPITTSGSAFNYRQRILKSLPSESQCKNFKPLMTCYLTDDTSASDLATGYSENIFTAAKLYPANATTNSSHGVTDILALDKVFEKMQEINMPLLIHGEVVDPAIDIFDREAVFIDQVLCVLIKKFPQLKIVLEHITTKESVEFVRAHRNRLAATVTAHHLFLSRNDLFAGGIHPHRYCLPIAKRESHRLALREAVTSGDKCFFLGTDTAPHLVDDKEAACGCAGIFTAPNALELYTQVFDEEGALDKLEGFASLHGPAFYEMNCNEPFVTLVKEEFRIADTMEVTAGKFIRPFKAGQTINWKVQ